jgi:predicted Zn-dependent protease
VLLPFSRQHELEADRLGVDFMARAGYRPSEAVTLWRNMERARTTGPPFHHADPRPAAAR